MLDFLNSSPTRGFSRASTGTYLGPAGVLLTAGVDIPRFEYTAAGVRLGLLMEPTRVNLFTYSSDLTNGVWTKTNVTVGANAATAPDGTATADTATATATASTQLRHDVTAGGAAAGQVLSIFGKQGSAPTAMNRYLAGGFTAGNRLGYDFDYATGGITPLVGSGASAIDYANGWWRELMPFTGLANGENVFAYLGSVAGNVRTAGDSCVLWGGQFEQAVAPSSFIPTTSSSAQRDMDLMACAAAMNPGQGTVLVTYWPNATVLGAVQNLLQLDDGTDNNAHAVQLKATGEAQVVCTAGGVASATLTGTAVTAGAQRKICYSYGPAGFRMSQDGAALVTAAVGALPRLAQVRLGNNAAGTTPMLGYQRKVQYWPVQRNDERALAA